MTQILSRRAALIGAVALLVPATAHADEPFLIDLVQPPAGARPRANGNILEVAAASGQFQTWLRAVEAAGYQDALSGPGPFTVFAPTDEAFRAKGQREVARLLNPHAHDELLSLLSYHVVASRVTTQSVAGRQTRAQAANGYRLNIDGRDGLRVNDELVVMPDIQASNGVIQGINHVLSLPVMVASVS